MPSIEQLKKLLELDPEDTFVLYGIAQEHAKAGDTDYDYAMLVNENVNVDTHCTYMPASSNVTFFNVTVNGQSSPPWTTRANCAGDQRCDCGNSASVAPNGDVTLGWKTGSA